MKAKRRGLHAVAPWRRYLFGRPTPSEHQEHTRLPKILALPVFASDAISSVAYATQEILLALSIAGTAALAYTQDIAYAIAILLAIVALSYSQTVFAYPRGGGSYIVAKDNLNVPLGLIAAASILIDYVLTVATSIASGVQNLVSIPAIHGLRGHVVMICVAFVLLLMLANLRGLKESGMLFAVPTYLFVLSCFAMILLGLFGPRWFGWRLQPYTPTPLQGLKPLGTALILAAFARGCSAMTGTEAISDGVAAFRAPASKNAALTLGMMAGILGALFIGISVLAVRLNIHYTSEHDPAVIAQLNGVVFGHTPFMYYLLQGATVAILVLAANTAFADFPRLSSILARDGFMPRQLANLGDRLTFTNGILVLGVLASVIIIAFGGNTDRLVPLYAIGVFIAFTLSQTGMVMRWTRMRGPWWQVKAVVNGIGATATFIVLCTIGFEKVGLDLYHLFTKGHTEFGWIVVLLIGLQYAVFRGIERHYRTLRAALSMDQYVPSGKVHANTILVLVPRLNRGVMAAIEYGRSLAADVRAVHIETDAADTPALKIEWERWVPNVPLVVLPSPYRSIIGPLLAYLDEVERERPDANITVVVPEAVTGVWWHSLLHANYGAWIKLYLLNRKNVVVSNVRYFVNEPRRAVDAGVETAAPAPEDVIVDTPATVPPAAPTSQNGVGDGRASGRSLAEPRPTAPDERPTA